MHDLLQVAADAHGGLERWNQLKTVKASVSVTGAIWQLKGKPDVLKDTNVEAELHKERLTTHFNGQGKRIVFEPNQIAVQTKGGRRVSNGRLVSSRSELTNACSCSFHHFDELPPHLLRQLA